MPCFQQYNSNASPKWKPLFTGVSFFITFWHIIFFFSLSPFLFLSFSFSPLLFHPPLPLFLSLSSRPYVPNLRSSTPYSWGNGCRFLEDARVRARQWCRRLFRDSFCALFFSKHFIRKCSSGIRAIWCVRGSLFLKFVLVLSVFSLDPFSLGRHKLNLEMSPTLEFQIKR